jgi:hypothetical protein
MTQLIDTLHALGLKGEIALGGRWVTLHAECSLIYVVEASWGGGYYTWLGDPRDRVVEYYHDPVQAIQAGLRRAAQLAWPPADN